MLTVPIRSVLVHAGGCADTELALRPAAELARRHGARLRLLDVDRPPTIGAGLPAGEHLSAIMAAERRRRLEEAADRKFLDGIDVSIRQERGPLDAALIREVRASGHDLVVAAAAPWQHYDGSAFAADELALALRCPVPVWLVRPGKRRLRTIVAVCGRPAGDDQLARDVDVLRTAAALAREEDAPAIHVVRAWDHADHRIAAGGPEPHPNLLRARDDAEASVERALAEVGEISCPWELSIKQGPARSVVPSLIEGLVADVAVLGTSARDGNADLIQRVRCSLFTVPG